MGTASALEWNIDYTYLDLLRELANSPEATPRSDRTGVGTFSLFGKQLKHDVGLHGFPLLTTKKVSFKAVAHELLWMLRGETNIGPLNDVGVTIWDEWADEHGDLGPIYGAQWRKWYGGYAAGGSQTGPIYIDQIVEAQRLLREDPQSRRIIVSAWNVSDLDQMALAPCHAFFQFYSRSAGGGRCLDLHLYQRSADIFLGVPFNIASYALLNVMMAYTTNHVPGRLYISFGDVHLYTNHALAALTQLKRDPLPGLPRVFIVQGPSCVTQFKYENLILDGYDHLPAISAPVAV